MAPLASYALLLLAAVMGVRGQVIVGQGYCNTEIPIKDFSEKNFLGEWYEVASTPNNFEKEAHHVSYNFKKTNNSISVILEMVRNAKTMKLEGTMVPLNASDVNGQYSLSFGNETAPNLNLMVVKTDYSSYATLWSCEEVDVLGKNMTKHMAWVLGRKSEIAGKDYEMAMTVLANYGVLPYYLKYTIQCSGSTQLLSSLFATVLSLGVLRIII